MTDPARFRILLITGTLLCVLGLIYPVAVEYILPDIEGYYTRRFYYENVISRHDLTLHPARYWKKIGEAGGVRAD